MLKYMKLSIHKAQRDGNGNTDLLECFGEF